ncbi:MAG: hypothetical protein NC412_01280 [Roseburia sp.]|nr:hypothetical protein [Roseburia sp.]MCM1277762.1 hypothetical protein [Robinsoniella sp.]
MEKEKKVKKFLSAIPFGIFWFIICYALDSLFGIAMLFCYIHPYEMLVVIGYFMVMILYYFHKSTNGAWLGYLEGGFLVICCIVGSWCGYVILTGIDNRRISLLIWGCRLMPLCLVAMLLSSFIYKRDKKRKNHMFAKIHKIILLSLLGFFCYLSAVVMGGYIFGFELAVAIIPVFVIPYIIIAQIILGKKFRWKLFFTYIIIVFSIILKGCITSAMGNYGLDDYDIENLIIASIPYAIAVAIGELIVWFSDKRDDSQSAKWAAENIKDNEEA